MVHEVISKKLEFPLCVVESDFSQFCLIPAATVETFVILSDLSKTIEDAVRAFVPGAKTKEEQLFIPKTITREEQYGFLITASSSLLDSYLDDLSEKVYAAEKFAHLDEGLEKLKNLNSICDDVCNKIETAKFDIISSIEENGYVNGYEVYVVNFNRKIWISQIDWEFLESFA